MPFKSIAQQHFLEAAKRRGDVKPSVVSEFEKATPKGAYGRLPEHVKRMAQGGMMCMHCGGSVDGDGYADGGEVESEGGTYGEQMRRREETRKQEGSSDAGQDMAELAGAKPKRSGYKVRAFADGGEVDDDENEDEARYGATEEDDEEDERQKHALFLMAIRKRR